MKSTDRLLALFVALLWCATAAAAPEGLMRDEEEPEEVGLTMVGRGYFPTPDGVDSVEVPNPSFETPGGRPAKGWNGFGFSLVKGNAPHGESYVSTDKDKRARLQTDNLAVKGNTPYLVSMWLKSSAPVRGRAYFEDASSRFGRHTYLGIPSTGGKWKRVGAYFRVAPGAGHVRFYIEPAAGVECAIDEVRLRRATEAEFSTAWQGWRKTYPERDLSPRPTDGADLALSVQKLSGRRKLHRPFLIWAIGSSYTNMLGDGEVLRQLIRKRFPDAPDIIYKKHVGSAVQWQYVRGWVDTVVIPEQPDLVLCYTIGKPEDLEKIIVNLRKHTTADIIVPTIHWRLRGIGNWGKTEDAPDQKVQPMREIAKKYNVEFVESRREWAAYMKEIGWVDTYLKKTRQSKFKHGELLRDAVHQSDYGALLINENIARHITRHPKPDYNPAEHERRLSPTVPKSIRDGETVTLAGKWTTDNDAATTTAKGASMTVTFVGNRLELIGATRPDGGTVEVTVDGKPAGEAEAYALTFIDPGPRNSRPKRGLITDWAPHGAKLGKNIVPQKWTIKILDDQGNYELVGSVTGPDGRGNNQKDFTSDSGQITIPAELWRNSYNRRAKTFNNKAGDFYTFEVVRQAMPTVSFKGTAGEVVNRRVVSNLPTGRHTVTLTARGDGPVTVQAVDVYQPPMASPE